MSLAPGARLGAYEVVSLLGAGGMGEVYRARDATLNRDVALKVLPELFALDPDRLARFKREAQVLASLNHPNIAAIYGFEGTAGAQALVLELVEGPTLADRIAQGPIPLAEALPIAKQIADALEAAHDHSIIHRDLKPANIKVRDDGTVKVLDFGLAKALEGDVMAANVSQSPTLSVAGTRMGVILGTAAYMSPEQARGQQVDRRADIWAFGCVLYEMLTGRQPFAGDTATDIIAGVMKSDPAWSALPEETPPGVRRVLRRCLQKNARERLRDVVDARLDLADAEEPPVAAGTPRRATWRRLWPAAALLLMIASYAAGMWRTGSPIRDIEWHGELLGGPAFAAGPRVSPDGQMLAFQAMVDGLTQVGIMRLQSGQWTILTDDRSRGLVQDVAWAPDGSSVYFDRFLDVPRGVFRVQVLGGEPRLVLDQAMTPEPLPDGSLVVVQLNEKRQRQMFRFWPETGRLEALNGIVATTTLKPAVRASPDGREVLFFGRQLDGPESRDHLYQIDLESGALRPLAEATAFGQFNWTFPLAVTGDGAEALIDIPSGDLHRIVALPRSGPGPPRTLLTLTARPLYIDFGSSGGVYADLVEQTNEIFVSEPAARDGERMVMSNVSTTAISAPLPLPDGRILVTTQTAGRNRMMAFTRGGSASPLVETEEETSGPMALVGRETVALMLGSAPNRMLALASTRDGRIVRRIDAIAATGIQSIAGSPDGRTLYYAASGQVSAIDLETGVSRMLHPGESVAIDPAGNYAVVALVELGRMRLVKVTLADGRAEEIPHRSEFALAMSPTIESNAVGRDGRIAVRIAPKDSWFWPTGILDPRTGRIDTAWPQIEADMFGGWAEDGRLIANLRFTNSRLWRFVPKAP